LPKLQPLDIYNIIKRLWQFINIQIICPVIDVLMHDSITALLLNIFNMKSLLNEIKQQDIELLLRTVLLVRE